MLKNSLEQVCWHQQESKENVRGLVSGIHANIHQTMIAAEKSRVAFEFLMPVRNKAMDAYEKIMHMQA